MTLRLMAVATAFTLPIGLGGCGSTASVQPECVGTSTLNVTPSSATLDHTAASQNVVQFKGIAHTSLPPQCPQSTDLEALVYGTWSNPDPTDIKISSVDDSTNGVASCINSTAGVVTLTGTFKNYTNPDGTVVGTPANLTYVASVTLTCK